MALPRTGAGNSNGLPPGTGLPLNDQIDRDQKFDPYAALRAVDNLLRDRAAQGIETSEQEQRTLEIARNDAVHAIAREEDRYAFGVSDWLRRVELQYLYQVKGIRTHMPSAIFGEGYSGYGNGWTGNKMQLLYPQDRKRAGRKSRELLIPQPTLRETEQMTEQLVPLKIDVSTENFQLKDYLLWNADDRTVPLKLFVESTLEDYGLPLNLASEVAKRLQNQINQFHPHIVTESDIRIVIKLDITVGRHSLKDQFEWDINSKDPTPEQFAAVTVSELGLPPEFGPIIAHAIREQSQQFTRNLFETGYQFDGSHANGSCAQISESSYLRPSSLLESFTPSLTELDPSEIDAYDHRAVRSRRRLGRSSRRGILAPEESPKQNEREIYTPLYSSVLPGGLDRNLDILRMTAYNTPDAFEIFHDLRNRRGIPSASRFDLELAEQYPDRFIVKLKMPRQHMIQKYQSAN